MKKVLITGGTGYIGSHTVVEFLEAGYNVTIVDNLSNSDIKVLDGIEKITGKRPAFSKIDLKDEKSTKEFFAQNHNFDVIIHFAAYKAVGESINEPLKYYKNNLFSLLNLLEQVDKYQIKNMIFSSSCSVYGDAEEQPVTEKTPLKKTTSPYGNTKQIAEEIFQDIIKINKNLNVIALRYFNPIGAHPSIEIGENPKIPNNLIPLITETVIGKREKLLVFGNDYNTKDGTPVRDYIHVVDVAKAHLIAAERLLSKKNKANFEAYNLGIGKGMTVLEIIKLFEQVTGQKVKYQIVDRREGDVEAVWADASLANSELGWDTTLSIADALRSAWEWQKKIQENF